MAFPTTPTDFMTPASKRGWIRNNITLVTWNKYPANQLLEGLKSAGMGIRRQDFLGIRREVLGIAKYQEKLESLPGESLVPKSYMQERTELRMTNNLQYRFTILGFDPETGERSIYTRAVSSNQWLTKEQAQEFIEALYLFPTENSNYIVEDILISEVWVQDMNKLL